MTKNNSRMCNAGTRQSVFRLIYFYSVGRKASVGAGCQVELAIKGHWNWQGGATDRAHFFFLVELSVDQLVVAINRLDGMC